MTLKKIISGGQTGVDRGALDAAIALNISHGGWCPLGRLAEDGQIPEQYRLREMESPEYKIRTEQNVIDSDATLILYRERLGGGTLLTLRLAEQHERPWKAVDLDNPHSPAEIRQWLDDNRIEALNVAGPRESQSHDISQAARDFLIKCFSPDEV